MPRRATTVLTPRQRAILEWIKTFLYQHGMPPTVREIGRAFGIGTSGVFDHLRALERKGRLRRAGRGARSLVIEGWRPPPPASVAEIPVVGQIAAGRPIEAIEQEEGAVAVQEALLHGHDGYALRVQGDSMVDLGILDGDVVIVRRQETAEDGAIVIALTEGEATLKRFYRESGGVRLEPANRAMAPLHVRAGEFRIQGTVVGVVRVYGAPPRRKGG